MSRLMPLTVKQLYPKNKKRELTKRAVIWLGQTCNLRCHFCYFLDRINDPRHAEHAFMSLTKAKQICSTLRKFYGCTSIDIQGGEPTIYPQILELVAYCRQIGLKPTLITNGLKLAEEGILEKYKEAGINDFLCSLHGIGEIHDRVVGRNGAYDKLIAAMNRMNELDIPFRINCTLSKPVIPYLADISQIAIDLGASVVNFIAYNPFEDQNKNRLKEQIPSYAQIKPSLTEAITLIEEAGLECNVRYLPLCLAKKKHFKNYYNFQQLSYDSHEWDYRAWAYTTEQTQRMRAENPQPPALLGFFQFLPPWLRNYSLPVFFYNLIVRIQQLIFSQKAIYQKEAQRMARLSNGYQKHEQCHRCSLNPICDGFHKDYLNFFGTQGTSPFFHPSAITDPLHFIKNQEKILDE